MRRRGELCESKTRGDRTFVSTNRPCELNVSSSSYTPRRIFPGTVGPEAAVARQFNFLEEHACRIRPVELGRAFGRLEVWTAPGDSELATSEGDSSTELTLMARDIEGGCDGVALLEVRLSMELVTNRGVGFSIVRTDMGRVSGQ